MDEVQNFRRIVRVKPQAYRTSSEQNKDKSHKNVNESKRDECPSPGSDLSEREQYDVFCKV